MLTFTRGFGPVSIATVQAAEKRLGVELPPDYKQFLCNINGGIPSPDCFKVRDGGDVVLGILYGIGRERSHADLQYEQAQATLWNPLPPGYLAIGSDPGGILLLMSTVGEDAGCVYYWDRVGFWVREGGRNPFPVAASFTEFVELLDEESDAEQDTAPDRGGN